VDNNAQSFHPPEPGILPFGKLVDAGIQGFDHIVKAHHFLKI
jgi:hypothetical protein